MNWRDQILDPDSINLDEFIRATFSIAVPKSGDVRRAAVEMLRILTIRTQRISSRTVSPEFGGAVIHVGPVSRWTEVTLALPILHSTPQEGLSHLLQLLTSANEYGYADGVWLQRVDLPKPYMTAVPGPQLGIEGLRSVLGVKARPLLGIQVGPRDVSLTPELLAVYRDALISGVDMIVDDILLGEPDGDLSLPKRLPSLVDVCRVAEQATGKRKIYIPCLAGSPRPILHKAEWGAQNGAGGFVLNAFTQSLGILEDISRSQLGVCLIATNMGSGMVSRPPADDPRTDPRRVGIDEQVFSKLSRLAGADAVHTGTVGSECFEVPWGDAVRALSQPLYAHNHRIPGSFRVAEGDLQMINLWPNMRELGRDTIFEVHSALLGNVKQIKDRTKKFIGLLEQLTPIQSSEVALSLYRTHAAKDAALRAELDANSDELSTWKENP